MKLGSTLTALEWRPGAAWRTSPLRKLRDDDASGALKEYFGDGEDPREWNGRLEI